MVVIILVNGVSMHGLLINSLAFAACIGNYRQSLTLAHSLSVGLAERSKFQGEKING